MSSDERNIRILQRFIVKSPLSHIGESISTESYLSENMILQPDGSVEPVFAYSGNAWRGQLRDLAATYMLEHLENPTLALDSFHLLYSGGAIGGTQKTDISQIRAYRRLIPMISLLGGGVGNQILPGKMRVSELYPVCIEAPASLYPADDDLRRTVSYRSLTMEKSFTRTDDAKNPAYDHIIQRPAEPETPAIEGAQASFLPDEKPKTKAKESNEPAQQMRFTSELIIPGTILHGHIDLLDVTEVELGCFVAALHTFSRSPHIGGQASRGHGQVGLKTIMLDLDTGEMIEPFVLVDGSAVLSDRAQQAKNAYDAHVRDIYDGMLAENGAEIKALIGAAA